MLSSFVWCIPTGKPLEVLKLFAGARVAHPAAALAAWKRSARDPHQLGKPLEAVIAIFNPEMAARMEGVARRRASHRSRSEPMEGPLVCHRATRRRDLIGGGHGDEDDRRRRRRIQSHSQGKEVAVERLGPAGAMVSARIGDTLILGSSRDELRTRASPCRRRNRHPCRLTRPGPRPGELRPSPTSKTGSIPAWSLSWIPVDSMRARGRRQTGGPWPCCRGWARRRINGNLALNDDNLLALDVTTLLTRAGPSSPLPAAGPAVVDRAWLTWVPARDAMGVVSMAFEPGAAFWDSAFALADRIERADPSRG